MKRVLPWLIVALLLPSLGCLLTKDFGEVDDDPTPVVDVGDDAAVSDQELVEQAPGNWGGLVSWSNAPDAGVAFFLSINADRTQELEIGAGSFPGTWSVVDGAVELNYANIDPIALTPTFSEGGQLISIEGAFESPEDDSGTETVVFRRRAEVSVAPDEVVGVWRSTASGPVESAIGARFTEQTGDSSYGVFGAGGGFTDYVRGTLTTFKCVRGECWALVDAQGREGQAWKDTVSLAGEIRLDSRDEPESIVLPVFNLQGEITGQVFAEREDTD